MKSCAPSEIGEILRMFFHYVGIESVEIAKQRIAYRVAHGGHGIPDADVERRYIKMETYIFYLTKYLCGLKNMLNKRFF